MTRIWRDQKISIISFVAHTGGLLGLCMGFSLVSLFEIVYYTLSSLPWKDKKTLEEKRERRLYENKYVDDRYENKLLLMKTYSEHFRQMSHGTPDRAVLKKNGLFSSPPSMDYQETPTDSMRTVGSNLELEYVRGGQIVTRRMDAGRWSVERLL